MNTEQLRAMLERMYDEREFLSRYGIRSLSKVHEAQPFVWDGHAVCYEPAESIVKIKGGNSNWRGPIWFPTTFLIIESLRKLGTAYGKDFAAPVPMHEMARDIARRMIDIFLLDETGTPPSVRWRTQVHRGPDVARSPAVLRVLPRRQRRGDRRKSSDWLDRARRKPHR